MKNHDEILTNRRQVLALLGAALPACLHQAHYSAGPVSDGRIVVTRDQLAPLKDSADVLYVRADGVPGTLAVRRRGDGYLALLAVCTHRACQLSALPQSYDCPCHGSRFDLLGEVLEGPAELPLPRYRVVPDAAGAAILLG